MAWTILTVAILALLLTTFALRTRRAQLRAMQATLEETQEAKLLGSHQAQLQYPQVDLAACIGCGACVKACPEHGVLGMVHGQAVVIHGARCVGHGLCAVACPTKAVAVTLGDLEERRDIPSLTDSLEAVGSPGLFLAGEVTGFALIRTAISHGAAVAKEVALRMQAFPAKRQVAAVKQAVHSGGQAGGQAAAELPAKKPQPILDLCIVGAGPAGISCALGAKEAGLKFMVLEQEDMGGTVAKYPRRKLVMTQPVSLPLHGKLKRTSYRKEELMQLWEGLAKKYQLPVRTGENFVSLEQDEQGIYTVRTKNGKVRAQHVCLCLGRRGTPRKLGVPGEDLPKVAFSLLDAQSYQHRNILVVGGGDSAIEAAVGLAEQDGNQVTLSYRKQAFFRIKARNQSNLEAAQQQGQLQVIFQSQVLEIAPEQVTLQVTGEGGEPELLAMDNDEVFVFAGGIPPFKLLAQAGVSFDPKDRPKTIETAEQGTGLYHALLASLICGLSAMTWALLFQDYYSLPAALRPDHQHHDLLKPAGALGLGLAILATLLIVANLLYLLRRSRIGNWIAGSLQNWLSYHMVTGVLAMLLVLVHSGMQPRNTVGGHAFLALVILVITGAIGRYFYAWLPKAANGRELALDEIKTRMAALSGEWDAHGHSFSETVRVQVQELVANNQWQSNFWQRLMGLLTSSSKLKTALAQLQHDGEQQGIPDPEIQEIRNLAKRAYRTSLIAARFEDIRGLLASWRYLHRWIALMMVLLAAAHIYTAIRFGTFMGP